MIGAIRNAVALACIALAMGAVNLPAPAQQPESDPKGNLPVKKKKPERKKDETVRFEGKLTSKEEDKAKPGHFCKIHEHKMGPGKTYVIEMTDTGRTGMDPYLRLEDSTGKQLMVDDDSAGNQNARIVFAPTNEETYRIIATTFGKGATGAYVVTVQPLEPGVAASFLSGGQFQLQVPVEIGDVTISPLPAWGRNTNNTGSSDSASHGYIEYRFMIENDSETDTHTVRLTIPRYAGFRMGHHLQSLRSTVEVGPGATRYVSLFHPDLPLPGNNDVEIDIDGRVSNRGLSINVVHSRGTRTNPYFGGGGSGRYEVMPMVLVPSQELQNSLRGNVFKSAVGVQTKPPTIGGYNSNGGSYPIPGPYFNKQYTYYEIVRFQAAAANIEGWSKNWLGYSSFEGVAMAAETWSSTPLDVKAAIVQYVECGGTLLLNGPAKLPPSWERAREDLPGFVRYYPGFGQCLVAGKIDPKTKKYDVAVWDPDDWRLITGMWEHGPKAWNQVASPTDANTHFPIVEGLTIPVRGLFVAMFLFVIIIGPLNVYWLSRSKRRIWLLWTVPAFSLVTCALLLAFMIATEGWHGHVRVSSITVLDEAAQRATSAGWQGIYCPLTPRGGLSFRGFDTELTPHLNLRGRYSGTRHGYSIDWSEDQHLNEGWVTSKVPVHFMVRRSAHSLERLTVRKGDDGSLAVVNFLGANVRSIHLAGADGTIHAGGEVRLGLEATLQATADKATGKIDKMYQAFAGTTWTSWADDMAQKPADYLRPGCYVAVLDGAPFVEPGLRDSQIQSKKLRTVVFGIMKDMP